MTAWVIYLSWMAPSTKLRRQVLGARKTESSTGYSRRRDPSLRGNRRQLGRRKIECGVRGVGATGRGTGRGDVSNDTFEITVNRNVHHYCTSVTDSDTRVSP